MRRWKLHPRRASALTAGLWILPAAMMQGGAAAAQDLPLLNTEDASLSRTPVGASRFHTGLTLDIRNGDFVRGAFDDDAASLDRVPFHAQLTLAHQLVRGRDGVGDVWLEFRSSNGFHGPVDEERSHPRSWYESNNLVGLIATPAAGWTAAVAFTVKASPNEISDTTQEVSASLAYDAPGVIGALRPTAVVTTRTKGDHGVYTQVGAEPGWKLGPAEAAQRVSVPLTVGVGWGGFYQNGAGDLAYGSVGLAYSRSFSVARTKLHLRADVLALIRDDRLRRLGERDADRGAVTPYGTVALSAFF